MSSDKFFNTLPLQALYLDGNINYRFVTSAQKACIADTPLAITDTTYRSTYQQSFCNKPTDLGSVRYVLYTAQLAVLGIQQLTQLVIFILFHRLDCLAVDTIHVQHILYYKNHWLEIYDWVVSVFMIQVALAVMSMVRTAD